jgi:hypothetical protein
VGGSSASAPAAARRSSDARHELVHAEGLGHVVIGSGVQSLDFVVGFLPRRQNDHRNRGRLANTAKHFHSLHVGQAEVKHDDVRWAFRHDLQGRAPVSGRLDVVVASPQVDRQGAHHSWLVVDHQDECHELLPPLTVGSSLDHFRSPSTVGQ